MFFFFRNLKAFRFSFAFSHERLGELFVFRNLFACTRLVVRRFGFLNAVLLGFGFSTDILSRLQFFESFLSRLWFFECYLSGLRSFESFFSFITRFVPFFICFNKCEPFLLSSSRSRLIYFCCSPLFFCIPNYHVYLIKPRSWLKLFCSCPLLSIS